jgi:hypothetical protein
MANSKTLNTLLMIDTSLFPYSSFPIRLEYGDKKDHTLCFFECKEHLDKYISRHKLDKRKIKVIYRDEQSTKSSNSSTKKVRQRTGKSSNGSTTKSKGNTKNLDSSGNSSSTRKSKSK